MKRSEAITNLTSGEVVCVLHSTEEAEDPRATAALRACAEYVAYFGLPDKTVWCADAVEELIALGLMSDE